MSTEPQKMKIKQALQICKDIEALHKTAGIGRFYKAYTGYNWKSFEIQVESDGSTIESSRHDRQISESRHVPYNFWTMVITNTAGDSKMDPVKHYVLINNNGMFPHAPMDKKYFCSGLAARIIYHKMKKEYKLAIKHKYAER